MEKITNRLYFVVLPILLLLSILTLVYSANNSHQNRTTNMQLAAVNLQLKKQVESNENIVKEQDRHLQCILAFFGTANRTNARISNFDPCTIIHNDTGASQVIPVASAESASGTTQPNSPASQQETNHAASVNSTSTDPTKPVPLPDCTVDVLFIHLGC